MKAGYVVLTYNRPDALLAVVKALAPQLQPGDVLVIADDGSRPDAVEAIERGLPPVPVRAMHVWHPDSGFTASRARNLGARAAHAQGADYLVFLDGDCIPNPHFANAHRSLAQPGWFVNGSRVLLDEALTQQVVHGEVNLAAADATTWLSWRLAGRVNKLSHLVAWPGAPGRDQRSFQWKGIRSCNFGVWYRDFENVNGFDETFSGWGHEDADLVLRLHHAGARRRNGWLATEVFHLWHGDNDRAGESRNRSRVEERMQGQRVRAERGLAELGQRDDAIVSALN